MDLNRVDKGNKKGLKIIGAGWGRTGTTTLKKALEMLGYDPTYHMHDIVSNPVKYIPLWTQITRLPFPKDLDEFITKYSEYVYPVDKDTEESKRKRREIFEEIFDGYEAAVDLPESAFFVELMEMYPNAKVILSTRDFESWYRSATNTVLNFHPHNTNSTLYGVKILHYLTPASISMRSIANFFSVIPWKKGKKGMQIAYDAWVEHVKQIVPKEKLLIVQVGKEGWKPFCDFLEIQKCPTEPFPHVNDEAEMLQRFRIMNIAGYAIVLVMFLISFYLLRRVSKTVKKLEKND